MQTLSKPRQDFYPFFEVDEYIRIFFQAAFVIRVTQDTSSIHVMRKNSKFALKEEDM